MELKELLKIIKQNIIFILVLALAGGVIGANSADFFSPGYNHTRDYFLSDTQDQPLATENLQLESFFQQEKPRDFTDSAVAILDSADFKSEVLKSGETLTVRKVAPQVVRLTYISKSPDQNFTSLTNVIDHFNQKIKDLTANTLSLQLKPIGQHQSPTFSRLNPTVLAVFGLVLGTTFVLFIVGLKNYFRL